jgi:hypothetical protein
MRCALVLFSNAALEGFSGLQVSRAPGSTVVSSHSSPADLAENHQFPSSRWSVDVGNRECDFQAWPQPGGIYQPGDGEWLIIELIARQESNGDVALYRQRYTFRKP